MVRGQSAVVQTEDLTRTFGGRPAVDGLNLHVERGEVLGLLGPNGAGKTTTIRILTTLLAPTSGRALICGLDVERQPAEVRALLGYVSQEKGVRHLLTGREAVTIEADLYHVPRSSRARLVDEVLDVVGLLPDADRFVSDYSGGMTKRLDLACGLLQRPEVLILDEPTLALDVQSRHRVWEYVSWLRDEGIAVLLATNYLDEAERLCDRVTIIDAGREVVTGEPAALKSTVGADVVRVWTPLPDAFRERIDGVPWVREAIVTAPGELHVHVSDASSAVPALIRLSHEHDLELVRIAYDRPTLEDVFLHHTGKGLQDPGGGEPPQLAAPVHLAAAQGGEAAGPRMRLQELRALLRRWWLEASRERLNLALTLLQPAIWLVFFGGALGEAVDRAAVGTSDYVAFMLPGVLAFVAVGVGIAGAIPLLWDKETGYLQRLMSMPIARSSVLVSRLLFQTATGVVQGLVVVLVALALGVGIAAGVGGAALILLLTAVMSAALTALFMTLAYASPGHTTFFAVSGFVTLPLVFVSSAFVPLDAMPGWMAALASANSPTYGIDAIRLLVLDPDWPRLLADMAVVAAVAAGAVALAAAQFSRRVARVR